VYTTHYYDFLHQAGSMSKDWETKKRKQSVWARQPKGLNIISTLKYGQLCLSEKNLSLNINYRRVNVRHSWIPFCAAWRYVFTDNIKCDSALNDPKCPPNNGVSIAQKHVVKLLNTSTTFSQQVEITFTSLTTRFWTRDTSLFSWHHFYCLWFGRLGLAPTVYHIRGEQIWRFNLLIWNQYSNEKISQLIPPICLISISHKHLSK
jgi:hypothetical protein